LFEEVRPWTDTTSYELVWHLALIEDKYGNTITFRYYAQCQEKRAMDYPRKKRGYKIACFYYLREIVDTYGRVIQFEIEESEEKSACFWVLNNLPINFCLLEKIKISAAEEDIIEYDFIYSYDAREGIYFLDSIGAKDICFGFGYADLRGEYPPYGGQLTSYSYSSDRACFFTKYKYKFREESGLKNFKWVQLVKKTVYEGREEDEEKKVLVHEIENNPSGLFEDDIYRHQFAVCYEGKVLEKTFQPGEPSEPRKLYPIAYFEKRKYSYLDGKAWLDKRDKWALEAETKKKVGSGYGVEYGWDCITPTDLLG
jgi:hypothetical protein